MHTFQRGALSLPRLIAALLIGMAAGWLAQHFLRGHGASSSAPHASASASTVTSTATSIAASSAPTDPAAGQARAARLQATLRLPDDPDPVGDDKVALPAGSRFLVEVTSDQAGTLEATTSRGDAAPSGRPLWTATLQPGQALRSPVMRLEGPTGLEHLHVVLRDARGQEIARRQLDIWHQ